MKPTLNAPLNDETVLTLNAVEPEEPSVSLADLEEGATLPVTASGARRRKRLLWAFLLLVLLIGIAGAGAYFLYTGQRVDLRANRRTQQTASNGSGIQRAAFASLSEALAPPPGAPPPLAPAVNIGSGQDAEIAMAGISKSKETPLILANGGPSPTPVNVQAGIAATLAPPPEVLMAQSAKENGNRNGNGSSQRNNDGAKANAQPVPNPAHSIRFAALPTPEPTRTPAPATSVFAADRRPLPASYPINANAPASSHKRTPIPPFGAMLPVRLLGVLHTLRPGALTRLELLRDIVTPQGTLKRGTVFIGTVVSGEMDRAYVQVKGFIGAESGGFVKLDGEVLGNDGGAGLRGKKRRISSVWGKVLDRTVQVGTQVATAMLGRQNSSVIIASDPYGTYRTTMGQSSSQFSASRTFVQVAAGAVGFVLVTTLPAAEAETNLARHPKSLLAEADPSANPNELSDEELVELMAEADSVRIRAALPRMQPELRKVAQAVLTEIEQEKKP